MQKFKFVRIEVERMKRELVYMVFIVLCAGYLNAQNDVRILDTGMDVFYINNEPGAYFTMRFDSGQFKPTKFYGTFLLNGRETYISTEPYDEKKYRVRINSLSEAELLDSHIEEKRKKLRKIVRHKVKVEEEQFIVEHRKRFILWTAAIQSKKQKKREYKKYVVQQFGMKSQVDSLSHQINLSFTANGKIVNLTYPVYWNDDLEEEKKRIKNIADNVNVYGFEVNVNALALQQDAANGHYHFKVEDKDAGITLYLPEWLNICTYGSNGMMFTMPEFKNNKGVVNVQWQSSREITFEKYIFNTLRNDHVTRYIKMKRPILQYGECYEVMVDDQWKGIYVFLKGEHSNVWVNYTAKPVTYELDIPKFREFVHGVEVR